MRYYRCRCGRLESWGSLPPPACESCEDCGTTLATHPHLHMTPIPHDDVEKWEINRRTGQPVRVVVCTRCFSSGVPPQPMIRER